MDYHYNTYTAGEIILRFVIGWLIAFALIVVISCIKYRAFIAAALTDNTWALVNAIMPCVIMLMAIFYIIRSIIR